MPGSIFEAPYHAPEGRRRKPLRHSPPQHAFASRSLAGNNEHIALTTFISPAHERQQQHVCFILGQTMKVDPARYLQPAFCKLVAGWHIELANRQLFLFWLWPN